MNVKVSVVMPVYNVEEYVVEAVQSVLNQSFSNFELLVIDDCGQDDSIQRIKKFKDKRIKIIHHSRNQGLAAARNTGIRNAQGEFIALIDSDDLWLKDKLKCHYKHLKSRPHVGLSFSRSAFIDQNGQRCHGYQMPQLTDITVGKLICRNPIGNGSAAVIRRTALNELVLGDWSNGQFFDENLRRSEDIECWLRLMLKTNWEIEGLSDTLTLYRINVQGLSAQVYEQLASWEIVIKKTKTYAPMFIQRWSRLARAYQYRYLARQAVCHRLKYDAVGLIHRSILSSPGILFREPGRCLSTLLACYALYLLPLDWYSKIETFAWKLVVSNQEKRIRKQQMQVQHCE